MPVSAPQSHPWIEESDDGHQGLVEVDVAYQTRSAGEVADDLHGSQSVRQLVLGAESLPLHNSLFGGPSWAYSPNLANPSPTLYKQGKVTPLPSRLVDAWS
jgi:hypothetical protein